MFASRRGSLSAPVIKHGKFALSLYSILINVHIRTDVRESLNVSIFAGGEGQGGRGEMGYSVFA
jgi:hypothetical protein